MSDPIDTALDFDVPMTEELIVNEARPEVTPKCRKLTPLIVAQVQQRINLGLLSVVCPTIGNLRVESQRKLYPLLTNTPALREQVIAEYDSLVEALLANTALQRNVTQLREILDQLRDKFVAHTNEWEPQHDYMEETLVHIDTGIHLVIQAIVNGPTA